jgi:hypothetical protein
MITNPNNRPARAESDVDDTPEQPLRVRKIPATDYDAVYNQFSGVIETRVVNVDAKVIEGYAHGEPIIKHYRNLREMMASPTVRKRVRSAFNDRQLKDLSERAVEVQGIGAEIKKLAEGSTFNLGVYDDETSQASGGYRTFPINDVVLPSVASPYSKQMLWADYLDMHRKAWEAATRNPIGKRICLSGDTPIPLLDGTSPTLRELASRGDQEVWVYACHDGQVVPARVSQISLTGYRPVLEVELDNGEVIRATADHPFMLRDGSYRDAGELQAGDSLMPLYRKNGSARKPFFYEQVWHPDLGLWEFTHRLVARTLRGLQLDRPANPDVHVHHVNDVSKDNRPENIEVLSQVEHVTATSRRERNREIKRQLPQSKAFGETVRKLWRDPQWRARQQQKFKEAANSERLSRRAKEAWAKPEVRLNYAVGMANRPKLATDPSTGRFLPKNHRVVAVRAGVAEPVYDMTVPDFENFAVGQGVFVHNCRIIPQFVLGRGAVGRIPMEDYQEVWDDFWLRNKMRLRMKTVLRELVMFGEVFLRYFQTRQGLVIRSIDPMTIWDIVTNPDDVEDVQYYHQQYVVLNTTNIVAPTSAFSAPSTMIIRQIPASEIDHFAINKTSSEKRGRSELYAILGWLQRFKEFANDRVLINKMKSMFALDVQVDGTDTDLTAAEAQFSTPPGPGAVTIHNKAIAIEFKNANANAGDAQTDAEMILKIIAIGAGVSEQFLGVSAQANRASALISTEPDVKNFEEYREIVEEMLLDASQRVWAGKRMARPKTPLEFTFPSIAQEDRSGKLKDLAFMEAMDWITKQRAATMGARELEITTYDYDNERKGIKTERGEEPVIAQGLQQLPKIQATPAEQPGMGAGLVPGKAPGADAPGDAKVTQTSAQMGFRADGGGRALSDTKATLNRPGFTRGGEKAAIKNNRTSGTPLLHANRGDALKRGWNEMAREKSLTVRREKAKARKVQMLEQAAKSQAE